MAKTNNEKNYSRLGAKPDRRFEWVAVIGCFVTFKLYIEEMIWR